MSEKRGQPFAYNLENLVREANPYLERKGHTQFMREKHIPSVIDVLKEDYSESLIQDKIYPEWRPILASNLVNRDLGVEGAVIMILDKHPLIADWEESDIRDLLDAALEHEILYHHQSLE